MLIVFSFSGRTSSTCSCDSNTSQALQPKGWCPFSFGTGPPLPWGSAPGAPRRLLPLLHTVGSWDAQGMDNLLSACSISPLETSASPWGKAGCGLEAQGCPHVPISLWPLSDSLACSKLAVSLAEKHLELTYSIKLSLAQIQRELSAEICARGMDVPSHVLYSQPAEEADAQSREQGQHYPGTVTGLLPQGQSAVWDQLGRPMAPYEDLVHFREKSGKFLPFLSWHLWLFPCQEG